MREQLIQYVNLLFAGAPDSEEIRAEILQNTLDRYDDLVTQGKSPEAAYRLAISGIGDISEILGTASSPAYATRFEQAPVHVVKDDPKRKQLRAMAIALYILCFIPLLILSDLGLETLGLSLAVVLAAVATYLILITKRTDTDEDDDDAKEDHASSPQKELKKSISNLIWTIGLGVYLAVSIITGAWYITWIIFPLIGSIQGLVNAIIDLKEANRHET